MQNLLLENDIVRVRTSLESDIDYIMKTENDPSNSPYVFQWTYDQHKAAMKNPDILHLVIEDKDTSEPAGYMIVAGVLSPHKSIELMRIAVSQKNKGFGRDSIKLLLAYAFDTLGANRVWLDVKEYNYSAQSLYKYLGFAQEGLLREAVFHNGKYDSIYIMAILKKDYLKQKKN